RRAARPAHRAGRAGRGVAGPCRGLREAGARPRRRPDLLLPLRRTAVGCLAVAAAGLSAGRCGDLLRGTAARTARQGGGERPGPVLGGTGEARAAGVPGACRGPAPRRLRRVLPGVPAARRTRGLPRRVRRARGGAHAVPGGLPHQVVQGAESAPGRLTSTASARRSWVLDVCTVYGK